MLMSLPVGPSTERMKSMSLALCTKLVETKSTWCATLNCCRSSMSCIHTYIHTHTHSQGDLCAVSTGQGPHLLRQQVHYRPYTATRERLGPLDIHTCTHTCDVPGRFVFFLSPKLALLSISATKEASLIFATRSSSASTAVDRGWIDV